jgi:hypothetical protein
LFFTPEFNFRKSRSKAEKSDSRGKTQDFYKLFGFAGILLIFALQFGIRDSAG